MTNDLPAIAGRAARLAVLALTAFAGGGCTTPFMRHPSFATAYRDAMAIAVLPPRFAPSLVYGEDAAAWEARAYAVFDAAIQEELEQRHFEVSWVQDTPATAAAVAAVTSRLDALVPRLLRSYAPAGASGVRPATFTANVGDVGPVLETFASDLVLWVDVGGSPGISYDFLGSLLSVVTGAPPPAPRGSHAFIRVVLIDASGEVIFFSSLEEDGTDVFVPKQAMGFVKRVMEPLPRR